MILPLFIYNPLYGLSASKNELNEIYHSTKMGVPGHLILYGPKGIGKTSLLLKFQDQISNFDDVYSVRIPLIEGNFDDIYTLIIEKCSNALDINIGHFWEKINSLGINIPLIGGISFSREIPRTSPAVAFEKMLFIECSFPKIVRRIFSLFPADMVSGIQTSRE